MSAYRAIEDILYNTLSGHRNLPVDAVRQDAGPGGVIDSLEGVELIIAAEVHFGIAFTDDEVTSQICRSIPQLAEAVAAKVGATVQ